MQIKLTSTDTGKFPLKYLLVLYERAHAKDVYCDYALGLKLLIQWLGPIEIPQLILTKHSRLIGSYQIQEIAKCVGCSQDIIISILLDEDYVKLINKH